MAKFTPQKAYYRWRSAREKIATVANILLMRAGTDKDDEQIDSKECEDNS